MRPVAVVPSDEECQLPADPLSPERDEKPPRAVVLQRPEEPLDDGDTAMLADGTVATLDSSTPTPASVASRCEHAFLITQEVARRRADVSDRATEESAQRRSIWLVGEDHPALHAPRVVVECHDNPPTERPAGRTNKLRSRRSVAYCRVSDNVFCFPQLVKSTRVIRPTGATSVRRTGDRRLEPVAPQLPTTCREEAPALPSSRQIRSSCARCTARVARDGDLLAQRLPMPEAVPHAQVRKDGFGGKLRG